jgi:hypothetical protein
LFNNKEKCIELGENAFRKLNEDFSAEKHYQKLITLFNTTIGNQASAVNNLKG